MQPSQLSIIVPIYNECDQLVTFFDTLSAQQDVSFELLLCDGGSTDGTAVEACRLAALSPFPIHVLDCAKGRSWQMNAGAKAARAELLLFLHVDSRFDDPKALLASWLELSRSIQLSGDSIAGHFSLKFKRRDDSYPELYYHMECKARLNRKECTHGDQGFMLSKAFFDRLGSFDDHYPIAEDTRFAERVRLQGRWLLFPAEIATSARRFEVEGIAERQTFNSILMNFVSIGWSEFFKESSAIYATQDAAVRLNLAPYMRLIHALLKRMSLRQRLLFWYDTGRYVRDNAWQIPFYFDTRCQYRAGLKPGTGANRHLDFHDKWIEFLMDLPPWRVLAGFLTWCWYRFALIRFALRSK
jgi:rSAM/selenodomain-associated transferase 2